MPSFPVAMVAAVSGVSAPPAGRLAADQPDLFVPDKVIEAADGIGTASHTGEHRVGQPPLLLQKLRLISGDYR